MDLSISKKQTRFEYNGKNVEDFNRWYNAILENYGPDTEIVQPKDYQEWKEMVAEYKSIYPAKIKIVVKYKNSTTSKEDQVS